MVVVVVVVVGGVVVVAIIDGSCHKYNFCRDKHIFGSISRDKHNFVATDICLSRQKYASRDKTFLFCCDKHVFERQDKTTVYFRRPPAPGNGRENIVHHHFQHPYIRHGQNKQSNTVNQAIIELLIIF